MSESKRDRQRERDRAIEPVRRKNRVSNRERVKEREIECNKVMTVSIRDCNKRNE